MYSTQSTETRENKLNNKGFSLLEVLVAVIILSIVSIPIIRSFATVAKTNADAKILLRVTDSAENMMENLEYRTLDELIDRYDGSDANTVEVDTNGTCKIVIQDVADVAAALGKVPDGYYMKIVADPTKYPNSNALNIADVKSMSVADTAVYEMSPLYDAGIYEKFDRWNLEANDDQPMLYQRVNEKHFREKLTRTMEVTIDKVGEDTDASEEKVDLVSVKLNIRYYFRTKSDHEAYLPKAQSEYVETTRELYNNISTKVPLSSIFILYQPRYLATASGNTDNIIINNTGNVNVNVMLSAQRGADDVSYKNQYFNALTGPNVTIIEKPSGNIKDVDAGVTLLTNLSSNVPYSSIANDGSAVANGKILCNLTYQNETGTSKIKGEDAMKVLDARDLDGKALIAQNTKNRIYKVTVSVHDAAHNTIVELDGTKLE